MKKQGRIFRFTDGDEGERQHLKNILKERGYRQDDIQTVIRGLEKICHHYKVSFSGKEKFSEHKKDMIRDLDKIRRAHDGALERAGRDRRHLNLEEAIVFEADPAAKIREKFDALTEVSQLRVTHETMLRQVVEQIKNLERDPKRPKADDDQFGYLILSILVHVLKTPRVAVYEAVTAACLEAVGMPSKDPARRVKAARDMLAERGVSPIIDEKFLS